MTTTMKIQVKDDKVSLLQPDAVLRRAEIELAEGAPMSRIRIELRGNTTYVMTHYRDGNSPLVGTDRVWSPLPGDFVSALANQREKWGDLVVSVVGGQNMTHTRRVKKK